MAKFDLKAYIENNRQQAMAIGGGIALLLIVLVWVIVRAMTAEPPADEIAYDPNAQPFGAPGTAMPGGPSPMPGQPGMPMQPGMPQPGMPGMPGGPTPGMPSGAGMMPGSPTSDVSGGAAAENPNRVGATPAKKKTPERSLYASRDDSFAPLPPKGNPAELERRLRELEARAREQRELAQLAQLPPLNIYRPKPAPGGLIAEGGPGTEGTATPETPVSRRVAGLMWGDRVAAVLETDGRGDVVRPGDVINTGGKQARVTRIDRDAIILRTEDKKTIRVPLIASPTGTTVGVAPGYPGGYPGMPGMPGGPMPMPGGPRMRGPQPLLPDG